MTTNPTESLATFLAGVDHDALPPEVRNRTVALLIDALACAILGRGGPETGRMEGLASDFGDRGDSTVIGSEQRSSVAGATLVNSYQITAFNLCDVYRPAHCHLSPLVVAPALAVAEQRHISGKQLLVALAAGFEAACRVGSALDFAAFRAEGWHSPGVIGPFGGAAAVGVIHGLDAVGMRNALGLAGSQSGGTMAQWGSPTIKFHQSRGALSGLLAGSLAAREYQAGDDVIAAEVGGILGIFSGGGTPSRLTSRLGEHWEMMNISLKRWPSGSGLQTTVSALFDLIAAHDVSPVDIEEVRVAIPVEAYKAHGIMAWDNNFKAMLSARYLTSVILHDRNCWTDQFEDTRRLDPDVDRFAREKVEVVADEALASSAARTEIELSDGSVLTDFREAPKGDPTDPLEISDVVAKYGEAADESTFMETIDQLIDLDSVPDVSPLIHRLGK
jgi:2-methylcitrate dehydratase PrpD